MTFVLIRIAIALVLFVVAALITKLKFKQKDKRVYLAILLCAVLIYTALSFIPFEDAFITFATRDQALSYVTNTPASLVIEGKVSDCIISKSGTKNTMLMIPKTENGYKVALGSYVSRAEEYSDGDLFFDIYRFKKTDDYYMVLIDLNHGCTEITDSCNSAFQCEEVLGEEVGTYCIYYCYIDGFDKNYTVTVNGKTYSPFGK